MYVLMADCEARSDNSERIIGSLRGQSGQKVYSSYGMTHLSET